MEAVRRLARKFGIFVARLPKDRRAQRRFLLWSFLAIFWAVEIAAALIDPLMWIMAPFVALLLWLMARSKRADSESLLRLSSPTIGPSDDFSQHRLKLAQQALIEAAFVDRAGAEWVISRCEQPLEVASASRSRVNAMLRERELWDVLSQGQRDKLMLPPGTWAESETLELLGRAENVRVLRWVLRADRAIESLSLAKDEGVKLAVELCQSPSLIDGHHLVDNTEMRTVRNEAGIYVGRCAAEALKRELLAPSPFADESQVRFLKQRAEAMTGRQSEDLLLGSRIVSEAKHEDVLVVSRMAWRRESAINGILTYLYGSPDAPLSLDYPEKDREEELDD